MQFLHISTSLLVHSGVVWIVTPCDPRCVTGFWGCMLWMPTRKHHCTVLLVRVPAQLSRTGGICFPLRVEMDCNDVGVICASWTEVFKVFVKLNHNPSCFLYYNYISWCAGPLIATWKRFPFRETLSQFQLKAPRGFFGSRYQFLDTSLWWNSEPPKSHWKVGYVVSLTLFFVFFP